MKKIMMVIGVIAIAMGVKAASVDWKLQTGTTYAGMTVYSFVNKSAADLIAACESTDATVWAAAFEQKNSSANVTGTNTRAGAATTATGVSAGDSMIWVIVDGNVAEGNNWYVTSATTVDAGKIYEPPTTGSTWTTVLGTGASVAGQGTFASVPEPTSGLLLLLGMAGLALKRKQA